MTDLTQETNRIADKIRRKISREVAKEQQEAEQELLAIAWTGIALMIFAIILLKLL